MPMKAANQQQFFKGSDSKDKGNKFWNAALFLFIQTSKELYVFRH